MTSPPIGTSRGRKAYSMPQTLGIYVFDAVEVLDFSGPFEVFSVANRLAVKDGGETPFQVVTIARLDGPIVARGDYRFLPSHTFATAPALDILLVPGGVTTAEQGKPDVIDWIREKSSHAELTASVCTGAFLLAEAGLLTGRTVTTHWEDADDLQQSFPDLTVTRDTPWVDEGDVVTSAGISAGIEMSLHLVERFLSVALARRVARQMEYTWSGE